MKKICVLLSCLSASFAFAQTNTFPATGNAGIGTTSPSVPLEIGATLTQGASIFKFGNPQQFNQIIFRDRSHSSFLFGVEANQIKIGTTGNEHKLMSIQYNAHNIELWPTVAVNSPSNILINAGGNVGIGNTNPQHKLDVNGGQRINGNFINTSWNGSGDRLLQVNSSGNVTPFNMGNATDVLYGNGTWGSLPTGINAFTANGNNLFTSPSTSLGLGISNPQYLLDVNGDAHIKNNLYVDGQILISERIESGTISTDTIRADTGSVVIGDTRVMNKFEVQGTSRFVGSATFDQGLTFDATNNLGIRFTPATGTTSATFRFGYSSTMAPLATCITPNINTANPSYIFDGHISARANNGSVNSVLNILSAPWNGSGYLEVEGVDENGGTNNGLFLNYFCGRSTYINAGANGGFVYTGPNLQVGGGAINKEPNTALNVLGKQDQLPFQVIGDFSPTSTNNYLTRFWTNKSSSRIITVNNGEMGYAETFVLYGDGKTEINSTAVDAFTLKNATTGEINFKVKSTGVVYAREINVQATTFPDYVFEKSYKLLTINELDNYITANKHLPGFKKAEEYVKDGLNVNEILIKQQEKLEELALYIIELKKEVEQLKSK